jgi:hypothetical protein
MLSTEHQRQEMIHESQNLWSQGYAWRCNKFTQVWGADESLWELDTNKVRCICFYVYTEIGTAPSHKTGKGRTAASPKFGFREAGMQVSPVKRSRPSPRATTPPCLLLFIKGPLKEGWGFCSWLLGALLWAFWCGKLLEGKRIFEGTNCWREKNR